jgi:hypothetical protein
MNSVADVLVVGAFRSGTNLIKHVLEQNYHVKCSFNSWGWKHALAPTRVSESNASHLHPTTPLIVMIKEPVQQNVSFFNHWSRTRPGLIGRRTFAEFIRSEFLVHDNSYGGKGPKYLFPTPTDYWNQFYFSYIFWEGVAPMRRLVRLEHLESDAPMVLAQLERAFSLTRRPSFDPVIPSDRVMPTPDGAQTRLHPSGTYLGGFEASPEDRAFILSRASPLVLGAVYKS